MRIVQLFDDSGIVPFAIESINRNNGEQYRGCNLKPMINNPLHAHQVSLAPEGHDERTVISFCRFRQTRLMIAINQTSRVFA